MNKDQIQKMRSCSHLLPDPGGEVVRECLDEITSLRESGAKLCGLLIESLIKFEGYRDDGCIQAPWKAYYDHAIWLRASSC